MEALETNHNGTKNGSSNGKSSKKDTKQRRYLPSLPSESTAEDMAKTEYSGLVDKTPVEFRSLKNYEMFSLSADGLFPMIKASRSKAVRLYDRDVMMVGSGRCYRIRLSSH
ncbi:MAG: hypothetical protein ACFB2X_01405 [Rivularia sp. (in: cyanobacteria)]